MAGARHDMKGMLGVSRTWRSGFEDSITKIRIDSGGLSMPPGRFCERFSHVTFLDLSICPLDHACMESLQNLRCLVKLKLGKNADNGTMLYLRETTVKNLDLSGCFQLTDDGLELLKGMPLTNLDLQGCCEISDAGLQFLTGMPLLALNLSGCYEVSRKGIEDAGLSHLPVGARGV